MMEYSSRGKVRVIERKSVHVKISYVFTGYSVLTFGGMHAVQTH